jgi:hypothetical protein
MRQENLSVKIGIESTDRYPDSTNIRVVGPELFAPDLDSTLGKVPDPDPNPNPDHILQSFLITKN